MDIKNTAITATMVIQSLVKLLENEDVDISSVKFKVGSEGDGYESPEFKLEKLIDLAYEGLEKIKQQATHEGSDLRFEQEDDAVWVFSGDSHQGTEISHLITSHIDDYNEDDVRLICHYAANEIDRLRAKLAKANPAWISISERMPNEGEEVFVHHFGHVVQATKDEKYLGGFKQRNCYGWEAVSSYISHWIPTNVELPQSFNFYYENDAKQKAMIEAQEQSHD